MRMDPRHLVNLLAIAKHGSLKLAAAGLGISPAVLSGTISDLEQQLGVPVLERNRWGCTLTVYGKILVRRAQSVDKQLERAAEEISLTVLGIEGPLRVGATPSAMLKLLPQIIERLSQQSRSLALSIIEGLDDALTAALQSGDLDIVVSPLSELFPLNGEIVEEALFEDPLGIAMSPSNALALRTSVALDELHDASWVLPGPGSAYRRQIEALFVSASMYWPSDCVTTNSPALVEYLVTHTNRVSIVSRIQTNVFNTWDVYAVPLERAGRRTIGVKWRRGIQLSPLAMKMVEIARDVAGEHVAMHSQSDVQMSSS
jgi:LysR family transcriptional regulator of gallate degradation